MLKFIKRYEVKGYATLHNGATFPWVRFIDSATSLKEATEIAKSNVIIGHAGIIKYLWTPKAT